jgi:hypothetical protein
MPFVSMAAGFLEVRIREGYHEPDLRVPATAEGARHAGAWLYRQDYRTWLCSSSIDHPEEYGGDAGLVYRLLLTEGWSKAWEASRGEVKTDGPC